MLSQLKISNYILIQELEVPFGPNLNTITGETGAGKSILLGALGLILGSRADTNSLLDPDRKCVLEGQFRIDGYALENFFTENDIDYDPLTILRREISPSGKSRAFINDTPVNLSLMKELGERLVDIHSQHQTIKLTSSLFQIGLVDAFANHRPLLAEYQGIYRTYRRKARLLAEMQEQSAQSKRDYEYHLYQLNEIEKTQIQPGELEALEEELGLLSNAENIQQTMQSIVFSMDEEESSVNNQLRVLRKQFGSLAGFNPALRSLSERMESLAIEAKDIGGEAQNFLDSFSVDSKRLEIVNQRIQVINQLLQKHHVRTADELLAYAEDLRGKISSVENLSGSIAGLSLEIEHLEKELQRLSVQLTEDRKRVIAALQEQLISLLKRVGMPEARVEIYVIPLKELNDTGQDRVDILFSANRGIMPDLVSNVASGGELSRLMLCFKYILASATQLPTIIFDEIDTGISGEVSIRVGQVIKELSERLQVMTITHQPQIAAMGHRHYLVYKHRGEDATHTHIRELSREERITEIVKMLAGHSPSALAVESAKELLETLG